MPSRRLSGTDASGQNGRDLDLKRFDRHSVGRPFEGKPWITHVNVTNLDRDNRHDILACDARLNAVVWLRQTAPGEFAVSTLMTGLAAPVHIETADMDGDGDSDLLVVCMGELFPNNDKIGSVIILENDGAQNFTMRYIAECIARVTDTRAGDFDGDGRLDLAVGQFGYEQGEIRWMRNLGNWRFESKILLHQSGTINVCVTDFNGDRTSDIVSLVSQQWEEIHLFKNDGNGNFRSRIIFGSSNEDYGCSGLSVCDLNRDGRPDLIYTNGDGMDYAEPGKRPWHGLQWLENTGAGNFRYHRIGNLPGAYSQRAFCSTSISGSACVLLFIFSNGPEQCTQRGFGSRARKICRRSTRTVANSCLPTWLRKLDTGRFKTLPGVLPKQPRPSQEAHLLGFHCASK